VTPLFAVSFWGYDIGQRLITAATHKPELNLWEKCLAGGFSAIPCTALMAPSERIKCLLQTGQYSGGMRDCAFHLFRTGGIPSLYKGTGLTLLRDIPGSMAWFGTYEGKTNFVNEVFLIETTRHAHIISI
jgi:solute carrier family 25 carnitine/acylcarnitine transporter 20/29